VVAIAAGGTHALALQVNGQVVGFGSNSSGQITIPTGLSGVMAVAAGYDHSLALRSNGTVVAWGDNSSGQINVPAGLSNVVAISAGSYFSMALLANGTVVTWGDDGTAATTAPSGLSNVLAIAAGGQHCLALLGTDPRISTPVIITPPSALAQTGVSFQYQIVSKNVPTSYAVTGLPSGVSINSATGLISGTPSAPGTYTVTISASNASGTASQILSLTVFEPAGPAGLAITIGVGQFSLSWSALASANGYNIKRATVSGGPYVTIGSSTGTSYTDGTVVSGTTYYYVVSAQTAVGESENSGEVGGLATGPLPRVLLTFDETSGTVAHDSSGNKWDGTLVGGPTWVPGMFNNAVSLNGNGQYVTLPTGVVSGLTDFTIAAWVKLNSSSAWMRVFDFGTGTTDYMVLTPQNGNNGKVRFIITTTSYNNEQDIDGTAPLPVGVWTHVAVSLAGTTGTLYVNGALVGTNANMTLNPSSLGSTFQNYIGKSEFADPYLNGLVDDFRIYGRALSATEINTLISPPAGPGSLTASAGNEQISLNWNVVASATGYNIKRATISGGPYIAIGASTGTSYTDITVSGGTTYYYVVSAQTPAGETANSGEADAVPAGPALPRVLLKFDEVSGTTAADSSGNGWNGTLVGGPTWVAGKFNNAINLNGSGQYVTLPIGVVNGLNDFTIAAWVKLASVSNWMRIFDFGTGTEAYMFLTPLNDHTNTVRYAISTAGYNGEQRIDGPVPLTAGAWTHVAVTLSGTTGTLYINGTAVSTNTNMTLNPSGLGITNLNYIGKSQFSDPYLNGLVDDFRIYGRALTATEINTLAIPPAAPASLTALAGNGQVSLSWPVSGGLITYSVKRSTTGGGGYLAIASGVASPNLLDGTVTNGTTYYYVVTAVSPGGESANSPEASVKPFAPISAAELVQRNT
jgi:fibronectin type 3 domain-containing protein